MNTNVSNVVTGEIMPRIPTKQVQKTVIIVIYTCRLQYSLLKQICHDKTKI